MADTDIPDTPQEVFKLLPAKARLVVFAAAALAGLALTSITTAFAAINAPTPQWLTIALAVFPVITSGLGILAGSNIQKATTTTTVTPTAGVNVTAELPAAAPSVAPLLADTDTAGTATVTTPEAGDSPDTATDTTPESTDAADTKTDTTAAATFTAAPLPEATPTA